jgi:hypothetical protein
MTLRCCSCFGYAERQLSHAYGQYGYCDSYVRKSQLVGFEQPSSIQLRANLGRQIISRLPTSYKVKNKGRFIAVTFTGRIIAVNDTLEVLNKNVARMGLKENYYIARLGFDEIAQI